MFWLVLISSGRPCPLDTLMFVCQQFTSVFAAFMAVSIVSVIEKVEKVPLNKPQHILNTCSKSLTVKRTRLISFNVSSARGESRFYKFIEEELADSYIILMIFSVNLLRCYFIYIIFCNFTILLRSLTTKSLSDCPLTLTATLFREMYFMFSSGPSSF